MSLQSFLGAVKQKLPALIEKANALKPLFNKGENLQTNQESQNDYVSEDLDKKIGETEEESPIKKYGMYALIGIVVFMLLKKKKML